MDKHSTRILSKSNEGKIFSCECCDHYNLNYRNIYMILSWRDLRALITLLENLTTQDFNHPSANEDHAFLKNPDFNMAIGLSKADVRKIRELFYEASLMKDVYDLLKYQTNP